MTAPDTTAPDSPIDTTPAAQPDAPQVDGATDSVGTPINSAAVAVAEAPAEQLEQPAVVVADVTVPISVRSVAQIRELTERLSAPEASIGAAIRGLLPV